MYKGSIQGLFNILGHGLCFYMNNVNISGKLINIGTFERLSKKRNISRHELQSKQS